MEGHRVGIRLGSALAAVVFVLFAAGCGSDSDSAAGGASTSTLPAAVAGAPTMVDPQHGKALMDQMGPALTIIDVRTPEEFAAGHIEGAVNIDLEGGGFSAGIEPLDRAAAYIVYCHSGRRSAIAAATMVTAGFTQVYDLGGIQAWQAAGLPVVTA